MRIIIKLTLVIILTGGMGVYSLAQTNSEIFGKVIEMSTGEPLEFVDVVLFNAIDDDQIDGKVSTINGGFRFTDIPKGNYYLMVAFVGFETKKTKSFVVTANQKVNLNKIAIQVSATMLADIEVLAEKSTYNLDIDRKIYNVEQDIMSQSSSATEILQNVPSVSVEVDGQVSLRGTTNVTYFINGKPSAMMRANPAAALAQIPASAIERIEIITNPSAKYKPDGVGGIINIVLKEDAEEGLNGTVSVSVGNLQRYLGNVSLNYNTEAFNVFGSYGFKHASNPQNIIDNREELDGNEGVISEFENQINEDRKQYSHLLNTGISFPIGEKSFGEIAGEFYKGTGINNSVGTTTFKSSTQNTAFSTIRDFTEDEIEFDLSAAFEHEFEEDHSLAVEIAHGRYDESENNFFDDIFTLPNASTTTSHILIEKGGPLTEFIVEYAIPVGEDTEIEAGYAGEFLIDNVKNLSEDFEPQESVWIPNPNKTNEFKFKQDVHAAYILVGQGFGAFSALAGLRAEQVLITSKLITLDTSVDNNYFRLYPSLHLSYELSDKHQFQLNYSRRVNRADSDEHNPFPEYENPRVRDVGNPKVKPEQIHSLELGYRLQTNHFTFIPALFYRYKFDGFADVKTIVEDTILQTSFTNLATDQAAGLEFVFTTNIRERVRLNLSANAFYNQIDASNLGFEGKKSNFSWDAKLAANVSITKTTYAQLNAYYRSTRLTPQGEFDPIILLNLGFRQDFFDKKASLTFTISDVFSSLEFESNIDSPELRQNTKYGRNSQVFQVGFIYRFGKAYQKKTNDLEFEDSIDAGKAPVEEP